MPSRTWSYPTVAESVPQARADLTEFAREAAVDCEVDRVQLDAIRLAGSEAISNAVKHAYACGRGDIQMSAWRAEDDLWVLVADEGGGLRARSDQRTGLGLGLVLIGQLASDFELSSRAGGGTQLRMRFRLHERVSQTDR